MDAGVVRGLYTLVLFLVFVGIVIWAWSGRRKQSFDEAARLPLEDGTPDDGAADEKGARPS